jgi:phage shock protein C
MRRFEKMLRGGMYRSRKGIILGVCRGIAEYFDFSVFWTRAIALILLFFTGLWPIAVLYFIAALLMKPEPVLPFQTKDQQEFYESYIHSRKGAADRLKRQYDNLQRRIQRMEHHVTSREFDWDRRLNT